MSMIDTPRPVPTYPQHHVRRVFLAFLAVFAVTIACVCFFYPQDVVQIGDKLVVKASTLTQKLQVQTPDGKVAEVVLVPPASQPNGPSVTYAADPNGQPQRTEHNAYGIYDKLHSEIGDVGQAMKDANDRLGKLLTDQAAAQKVATDALSADIAKVATEQKKQGDTLTDVVSRVSKLETAQTTSAPAQPAPQAPPAATSQATPAPQASVPDTAPVRFAQAIISPRDATDAQMKEMLKAYGEHGAPPNGAKITGFAQIPLNEVFTCPKDHRPAKLVNAGPDGRARLWDCRPNR